MSQWYYSKAGQQQGPVSEEQLRQLAISGQLQPSDLIWKEGMSQWTAAGSITSLFPNAPATSTIAATWYYSKAGQRLGPISSEQLKQLAAIGQLQPDDLVWKTGMSQWNEARKLNGLFPTPTVSSPLSPPLVPTAAVSSSPSIPVTVPAIPTAPLPARRLNPPASGDAPALWNPQAAGLWSALFGLFLCSYFGWAFGAFLLARNWRAIGNVPRAKRSMIWFCSIFAWVPLWWLIYYLTSQGEWSLEKHVIRYFTILVIFFAWAFLELKPQATFIKEHFSDQYPRKKWRSPLAIAASLVILVYAASFAIQTLHSEHELGKELTFNGGQLFYEPPVTAVEANRLGNFLVSNNVFTGDKKTTQITRLGDTYQFRMVAKKGIAKDQKFIDTCRAFCGDISRGVFNGAQVEIHVCDENLNTLRVIKP